jgi:glucosylceramidase
MAARNPPVAILGFDHNKGTSLQNWATGLYGNAAAKPYLAGLAEHWYGSSINPFTDSLDFAHNLAPTLLLIGAEQGLSAIHPPIPTDAWKNDAWYWGPNSPDWACTFGPPNTCTTAGHPFVVGAYRVAEDIIASFNHWENGWIQWNAVTDKYGGPSHGVNAGTVTYPGTRAMSPYMVDLCGQESCADPTGTTTAFNGTQDVYDTPTLYILQHFSRFMLPGGHVVASTVDASVVTTTSYAGSGWTYAAPDFMALAVANPDGSLAVALLNEKAASVDYQIALGPQAVEGTISASALQTVVIKP